MDIHEYRKERDEILLRKPPEVRHKLENYSLYTPGFFGNKPLTWDSYEELLASRYQGEVCIRVKRPGLDGKTTYHLSADKVDKEVKSLIQKGFNLREICFNQAMPDERLIINAEVMLQPSFEQMFNGIYVFYSHTKKPMKHALAESPQKASGVHAWRLLRNSLDAPSFDNLLELLDLFPESVIELSSWEIAVGHLNRNTVFWEVRNY